MSNQVPLQQTPRDNLKKEVLFELGHPTIRIELNSDQLDYCITKAIDRYRYRSVNSTEESYMFLELQADVENYTLPNEVQDVRNIFRRGIGGTAGGASIDPFALAWTNNIYMIQNPGNLSSGGSGTLATYDFAMEFQKVAGRMFGQNVTYQFDPYLHKLHIDRRFLSKETVMLWIYNQKPENSLIASVYSKTWIRDYAASAARLIIGEARDKFAQIAGPQGGITLNGAALIQRATEKMAELETDLIKLKDSDVGYGFVIG